MFANRYPPYILNDIIKLDKNTEIIFLSNYLYMNKYRNLLIFLLFLIIIFSLFIANNNLYDHNFVENFTQMEDNFEYQSAHDDPFAFGPESDVPDQVDKDNKNKSDKNNNLKDLPLNLSRNIYDANAIFKEEDQINATKDLLLDEKFAREYPELYEKIVKIVFKDFMNNPEEIQYKLTVSNKSCANCPATNLISSLSTLDPIQLQKIKVAIEEQGISAGNCDLAYPHPSYAVLNNFKQLSTCNQDCDDKNKTGSCPPLAFNCLIQDTGIWN